MEPEWKKITNKILITFNKKINKLQDELDEAHKKEIAKLEIKLQKAEKKEDYPKITNLEYNIFELDNLGFHIENLVNIENYWKGDDYYETYDYPQTIANKFIKSWQPILKKYREDFNEAHKKEIEWLQKKLEIAKKQSNFRKVKWLTDEINDLYDIEFEGTVWYK